MSLPSEDRVENIVNSTGIETYPEGVLVKGSLWTLNLIYGRFLLKNYEGNFFTIDIIVKDYTVTLALNDDRTINTDKFWLWVIDVSNNVSLYEVEPFVSDPPIITAVRSNIASSVVGISSYVQVNDAVRVVTFNTSDELIIISYPNIKLSATHVTKRLPWEVTRIPDFSNFVSVSKDQLHLAYLNVKSPPNVYLESYTIVAPNNLVVSQVGDTAEVYIDWDASTDADGYVLERDTDSSFSSPTQVYSGAITNYTDTISELGIYYYRVRAVIDALLLQSLWSGTQSVEFLLITDFEGTPLVGEQPLSVQFTDLSTPIGAVTAWDWDFGDDTPHSTEQNPLHTYNETGVYTVTLTSYVGLVSATETKPVYVTVFSADFEGTPLVGKQPLSVQFTDLSTPIGSITAWSWDFGDGFTSTEQNPLHTYTGVGVYTVTLTSYVGVVSATEVKTEYVTVFSADVFPDFIATPLRAYVNEIIQFTDLSTGDPIEWDWNFGDRSVHSTEQNPVHSYSSPGFYTVTLRVGGGITSNAITKVNYIEIVYEESGTGFVRGQGPTLIFD